MAESAKKETFAPIDAHLLDTLLEQQAPDLESSDERLEKVNGLVSKSDYLGAGRAAEAQLRQGLFDVRLVGPYLMGLFLVGGMSAMPMIFHGLSSTLLRNWEFFGPHERKDVFADTGIRWLLKVLNRHLEHHERLKDETWQRWRDPSHREPLEQALALSEEIFACFARVMPSNGCEAPFRRFIQWLEEHLASLPVPAPEPEAEPEPLEEPKSPSAPARPPASHAAAGPSVPVSPALAELIRKLSAFDTLIERGDVGRASVVAADVLAVVERFDPRVYLPSLFSRFFSGLSKHAEQVEPVLQGTESLSFRAMDQLYRVDLETFLAQSSDSGGTEE